MASPEKLSKKAPSILVIRAGAIGDTLMATPLLRALRRSFPDAYIGAITSQPAFDVLRFNPYVNEVFPLKNRHLPVFLSLEKRRLIRYFRSLQLDHVLSLESNSDFTALAQRFGAAHIVTYDQTARGGEVMHVIAENGEHSARTHIRAGETIGGVGDGNDYDLFFPAALDTTVAQHLAGSGISETDLLIGFHAGWGGRIQDPEDTRLRSWPAERFSEVIHWAHRRYGAKIVLTGTANDREANELIGSRSGVPFLNVAGQLSLLESAALIRRMNLYISTDSGPAHMAAALGTRLITLWGPGIFTATAPFSTSNTIDILRSPPACAPCYGTPNMKLCRNNICMKQIGVDEVKGAIGAALG